MWAVTIALIAFTIGLSAPMVANTVLGWVIGLVSFPVKLQALLTTSCDVIAPIIAMAVSVQLS